MDEAVALIDFCSLQVGQGRGQLVQARNACKRDDDRCDADWERQDLIHEPRVRKFISLFTTHAFGWRMRWNVQMEDVATDSG